MINLEIETIEGVRKAFPKTYVGTAIGGYKFAITYDNHLLEVRAARQGDPRTGPIILNRTVPDAAKHDILDERMIQEIERSGVRFLGRKRIL